MLEAQHALVLKRIDAWTADAAEDPAAIVDTLFDDLAAWAGKPGWQGSGFTRSVMELADMPGHPARAVAQRHKAAIESWLAERLGAPAARQVMLLIEGCHSLILIHGDTSYAKAAAAAAKVLIEHSLPARHEDII